MAWTNGLGPQVMAYTVRCQKALYFTNPTTCFFFPLFALRFIISYVSCQVLISLVFLCVLYPVACCLEVSTGV